MHNIFGTRTGILCLLASFFLVTAAAGKDGRDFAGYYSLSDISGNGDQIQITLNVELSNYTGQDLNQAVIRLQAHPEQAMLGSFAPVELWRNGGKLVLSQSFKLPRREYERWSIGGQPELLVVYRDPEGHTWQRTAQLNSRSTVGVK